MSRARPIVISDDDTSDLSTTESESFELVYTTLHTPIPQPRPQPIRELDAFWRTTLPGLTTSDRHMYGEATSGSLWKIWGP